jgi:hypothetical protein
MWKSKVRTKQAIPHSVDGATEHSKIANKFADVFESFSSNSSADKNVKFRNQYFELLNNYTGDMFDRSCLLCVDDVDKSICDLKLGKAASLDGLTAEHVKYCHPVIVSILVKLFNLMILSHYVPNAFGVGLCIPLLKSGNCKNQSSLDAYRGITVSPVLSKIFEIGVGSKLDRYLNTSDLQFGFKKKLSCSHAIYSVRKTVEYFTSSGSTVNLCAMDLSRAFDKLNHHCLFIKLMERRVPVLFVLLFECWYSKTFITVRWGNAFSYFVRLKAGVRQGGILSPRFFVLYVDEVLTKLNDSKLGCYIRGFFVGAFMYADDLLLLSASLTELQLMVNLCASILEEIDMTINIKKTMCIRIGTRCKAVCCNIILNQERLSWVSEIRYLGVFIRSFNSFKISLDEARKKFFISSNSIFSKVNRQQINVVLSLIQSYCIPILLYGLEAVSINKTDRVRLENPYTMVFNKLFGTFNKEIISHCQYYTGCLPLCYLLDMKIICFLQNFVNLKDDNFTAFYLFSLSGISDLHTCCARYNILRNDSKSTIKRKMFLQFALQCGH